MFYPRLIYTFMHGKRHIIIRVYNIVACKDDRDVGLRTNAIAARAQIIQWLPNFTEVYLRYDKTFIKNNTRTYALRAQSYRLIDMMSRDYNTYTVTAKVHVSRV